MGNVDGKRCAGERGRRGGMGGGRGGMRENGPRMKKGKGF
jgi:hypothetical protein